MGWADTLVSARFAAAGVPIGGAQPWAIQVRDARFFGEVLARGSLGFGETYVAGDWERYPGSRRCCRPMARCRR